MAEVWISTLQKLVLEVTGEHFSSLEHIHCPHMDILPSLHFSEQRLMHWLRCISVTSKVLSLKSPLKKLSQNTWSLWTCVDSSTNTEITSELTMQFLNRFGFRMFLNGEHSVKLLHTHLDSLIFTTVLVKENYGGYPVDRWPSPANFTTMQRRFVCKDRNLCLVKPPYLPSPAKLPLLLSK